MARPATAADEAYAALAAGFVASVMADAEAHLAARPPTAPEVIYFKRDSPPPEVFLLVSLLVFDLLALFSPCFARSSSRLALRASLLASCVVALLSHDEQDARG